MNRSCSHWRYCVPLACALFAAAPVHAEPRTDAARRDSYERGVAAMKSRSWREALQLFQGLWQEEKTYDVALMLGQIQMNLENFRDAAEYLDFGIRNAVPREKLETLARSRKLLELAKGRVATLEIRADRPGADIEVDGKAVGRAPLDFDVYAAPGARLVEATAPDAVVRDTVEVRAGERRVVTLEFPEAPAPDAPELAPPPVRAGLPPSPQELPPPSPLKQTVTPEPADTGTSIAWPVTTGVVAGVALLVSGGFFLAARAKENERDDLGQKLDGTNPCGYGQNDGPTLHDCRRIKDLSQQNATFKTIGATSLGVSLVFAAATTYLLWPRAEETNKVNLALYPALGPTGMSFQTGLNGSF